MREFPRGFQKSLSITCGGAWMTFLGYLVSSLSWIMGRMERYVFELYSNERFPHRYCVPQALSQGIRTKRLV